MTEREKILRRVALKCADFARQISYHHALGDHANNFRQNFWIVMFNNAIDIAVLDWFHLFGYHNDDLHWKRVVQDVDSFRQGLVQSLGMSEPEWTAYRESIKDYRDKDVAHIEVRPVSHVPDMAIALQAVAYYYTYLLTELLHDSQYNAWPKDLKDYYQRSFAQTKPIVASAYTATSKIEEKVW